MVTASQLIQLSQKPMSFVYSVPATHLFKVLKDELIRFWKSKVKVSVTSHYLTMTKDFTQQLCHIRG